MLSVLIIDDHEAVSYGVKAIIEKESDITADILPSFAELPVLLTEETYDVYLVDLQMPGENGLDITKRILQVHPNAKVIIYTGYDIKPLFNKLIECGVSGIVSKGDAGKKLVHAIRLIVEGEVILSLEIFRQLRLHSPNTSITKTELQTSLTDKERAILIEVEQGKTNKEISVSLHMSQRSIEYILTSIYRKLGVSSRVEAVRLAREFGGIPG